MSTIKLSLLATLSAAALAAAPAQAITSLTIFHNNDGESRLLPVFIGGVEYAGASRFVTAIEQFRGQAIADGRDVLTISSGDNFLAGPQFNASLDSGIFYDARVLNRINYDAIILGNHEFDFGTQTLANFIGQTDSNQTFLSANLDFTNVPELQALRDLGRIASSTIVTRGTERYGIVGATTDLLPIISSPGATIVNPVVGAVQAEIDSLTSQGINKIIFASHLQTLATDQLVLSQLRGVDFAIAGGSSALLTNSLPVGGRDVFGDAAAGAYPIFYTDADGNDVPVVTTTGEYRYLGRIDADFDDNGVLLAVNGNPILIDSSFAKDPDIEANVVTPVSQYVAELDANVLAQTEVALDGTRNNVRSRETNEGNLVADGFVFAAEQADLIDPSILTGDALIGAVNGGGIRNNSVLPVGGISELDTFDVSPFGNFVSVVNGVSAEALKTLLEFSVADVANFNGRFLQVSGLSFSFDPTRAAGNRVFLITLADGRTIFRAGEFRFFGELDLVTTNFTANGGDGFPFAALGLTFRNIGLTDQQALARFLTDGLGGVITAADYAPGGEGRIVQAAFAVPEASTWAMMIAGFGMVGAGLRRRRAAVAA